MEIPGQFLVEINRLAIFCNCFKGQVQQEMAECWRLKVGEIDLAQSKESVREHGNHRERVSGINSPWAQKVAQAVACPIHPCLEISVEFHIDCNALRHECAVAVLTVEAILKNRFYAHALKDAALKLIAMHDAAPRIVRYTADMKRWLLTQSILAFHFQVSRRRLIRAFDAKLNALIAESKGCLQEHGVRTSRRDAQLRSLS